MTLPRSYMHFQARVLLLVVIFLTASKAREAAIWIDDGNGHTVREPLSPRETREFSRSLRETMGLPQHRPHFSPAHTSVLASAPTFMKSIYNALDELGVPRDSNLDTAHRDALERADTVVTFTSRAPPDRWDSVPPKHHAPHRLLYFDTSEVSLDYTILGAELRLHYQPHLPEFVDQHLEERMSKPLILHAYVVADALGSELEVAQLALPREERWLQLNVTLPTLAWIIQPSQNRGFRLAVTREGEKHELPLHSVGVSTAHDREDHRPILVCFFTRPQNLNPKIFLSSRKAPVSSYTRYVFKTEGEILSRVARSPSLRNLNLPRSDIPRSDTTCQMRPLHVSFKDLDWENWVIAPDGYDANFCQGRCDFPIPPDKNATNHAIVQTLIKVLQAVREGETVPPAACCTPNELATISVLYYDYSNNVVLKKYPKMIVKNCACR
ncbi:bone morphogenetic protein 8A isoform X2 [Hyalella azteca]|uniref:Bone morphogenetic protein 8A isoform X1 n=1 Tax=Hyalella azteca TaxID=294128 RepID=A0A8B7PFK2_HYAAZ|nr:bone morphogenetic protein 8A isoform X1 [Hyalella azteca]XP_018024081.1 bone morphogenetic protein 8A isoform X2 [Hyalella azteca]